MSNWKILACPFCGHRPKGAAHEFASTVHGPALLCVGCGAGGPTALGVKVEQEGADEARYYGLAIKLWNDRPIRRMLSEARALILKAEVSARRTKSFSPLHAEMKHWLEYYRKTV